MSIQSSKLTVCSALVLLFVSASLASDWNDAPIGWRLGCCSSGSRMVKAAW